MSTQTADLTHTRPSNGNPATITIEDSDLMMTSRDPQIGLDGSSRP